MTSFRAFIALAAATLSLAAFAGPAGAGSASPQPALAAPILVEINAYRAQHGLSALRVSKPLRRAALAHAKSMASGGFFAHESADGTPFWKRVKRFYGLGRGPRWSVGENLLWRSDSLTPGEALQMWIDSPGHRKVLLTAAYREIGISAVRMPAARGVFAGRDVIVVTADFGVR